MCHTPTLHTGKSSVAALQNKDVHLYSDLTLHNMGPGLADDVSQGDAGGDEFRTAPLWGLGKRIFFLHDGRTKDLLEAIHAHASGRQRSLSTVGSESSRRAVLPARRNRQAACAEFPSSLVILVG